MTKQDLLRKHKQILEQYHKGIIGREAYQAACQELRWKDVDGTWWSVDPVSGKLLTYDQEQETWRPEPETGAKSSPSLPHPISGRAEKGHEASLPTEDPSGAKEPHGCLAAILVLIASAVVSLVLWYPLGLPSALLRGAVPQLSCKKIQPESTLMYLCSMGVALVTLIGPLLFILIIYRLRKPLRTILENLVKKTPEQYRFLMTSLFATIMFLIMWAGAHFETGQNVGLVPHMLFPVVIGLFTFVVGRYGGRIQKSLAFFFRIRDLIPRVLRLTFVLAVPFALSYKLTKQERVKLPELKEQIVVIAALLVGYLMLVPRRGDLIAGIRKLINPRVRSK